MTERTCIICDAPLNPRQKLACSQPCRMKHYWTTPEGQAAKKRAQDKYRPRKWYPCTTCGATMTKSGECWECRSREEQRRDRRRRCAAVKLAKAASGKTTGRVFVSGECARCGQQFTVIDQLHSRYCSRSCLRATSKDRRRAVKRHAYVADVNRRSIYERDDWTCQLCSQRVNRSAVVPHPRAPVIDHILPLAAGGTHEPANTQCAHFLCNSLKGDRPANDQLRLVG